MDVLIIGFDFIFLDFFVFFFLMVDEGMIDLIKWDNCLMLVLMFIWLGENIGNLKFVIFGIVFSDLIFDLYFRSFNEFDKVFLFFFEVFCIFISFVFKIEILCFSFFVCFFLYFFVFNFNVLMVKFIFWCNFLVYIEILLFIIL